MAHEYVEKGIPFLRSQNVLPFRLDYSNLKFVTEEFHRKLKKSALSPGDVVVVRTGYPGTACVIPKALPVANCADLVVIRPSVEVNSHFLCCVFNSAWGKGRVAGSLVGVAQQHFNIGVAREMEITLPPIEAQDRIADILSAYDDLLENNTRRIKILEEMAQMLYREWFVNFRFPGHEKVRMVDSEIGPIPQGWKTGPLESVCDRVTDGSHWSPTTVESGRPMASSKDMHRWGLNLATCRMISDDDFNELVRNDCRPLAGDVLITKDGANYLKYCFAVEKDMEVVLLSSVAMIRPNPAAASSQYLEFHLSDGSVKTRLARRVSGAAIPRIVLKDFRQFTILIPPISVQRRFEQLVKPFVALCWRLIDKNVTLRTTRDFLLPKLISGEVSVEAAEETAAELPEEIALHA